MSENEEQPKKKEFDINIDTTRTEALSRENERQKLELEDLKSKMAIVAEKQLRQKMDELHVPQSARAEIFGDPSLLRNYEHRETPAGSPLVERQMGNQDDYDLYKRKFGSEKEMIDAILEDMHGVDPKKAEIAHSY